MTYTLTALKEGIKVGVQLTTIGGEYTVSDDDYVYFEQIGDIKDTTAAKEDPAFTAQYIIDPSNYVTEQELAEAKTELEEDLEQVKQELEKEIEDAELATQKWLPSVETKADLPQPSTLDPSTGYLCRVRDDETKTNNGVWQLIAGAEDWNYFSDNLDFIDPEELAQALEAHNTSGTAHQDIRTALGGKQATLVSGTNIKTINGTSVLGGGDVKVGSPYTQVFRVGDIENNGYVTLNVPFMQWEPIEVRMIGLGLGIVSGRWNDANNNFSQGQQLGTYWDLTSAGNNRLRVTNRSGGVQRGHLCVVTYNLTVSVV
jgi:hypothetical protein